MATRRGSSGKKGGGGFGDLAGKLVLYALATVGGCYIGGKALNLLPHDELPKRIPDLPFTHTSTFTPPRHTAPHRERPAARPDSTVASDEVGRGDADPAPEREKDPADAAHLDDAKATARGESDEIGRGEADTSQLPEVTIQEKASPHKGKELDIPAQLAVIGKGAAAALPSGLKAGAQPAGGGDTPVPGKTAPPHPFPPVEVDRGSTSRKEVALTFDAGSDWKPVRKIVETLAAENVKSTFFLTGEWVKKNPRSTHLIAESGHELGNHSWDHPAFTGLSDDAIKDQLRRTDEIIEETVGRSSHPYFRPPLGARDTRVKRVVGEQGYLTIYWTLDSRDSVDKGITAEQIRDRILAKTRPGSIILMHCGSRATADALPEIIKGLKERGLTPVPVSRLLQQ